MANFWYIGSTKYDNVAAWQPLTAYVFGSIIRPPSAAVGYERCYICTVAGTSDTSQGFSDTRGALSSSGTVVFREATGMAALNGDAVNTPNWTPDVIHAVGDIIKNVSGGSDTYFYCVTAGTSSSGSEPAWNKSAGLDTTDGTVSWLSLGAISSYSAIWAAPHARIQNSDVSGWGVDGDTFYISSDHAEVASVSSSTLIRGSAANPSYYLCVNDASVPPSALATTAAVTISYGGISLGNPSIVNYCYGVSWLIGTGTGGGGGVISITGNQSNFENCNFYQQQADGFRLSIILGAYGNYTLNFLNCNFAFSNSDQSFQLGSANGTGIVYISGGAIAATATAPSNLFDFSLTSYSTQRHLVVRDVDLSGITGTLFTPNTGISTFVNATLQNCRLGSGVTIASAFFDQFDNIVLQNCDNTAKNYRVYTTNYSGLSESETSTFRNGGASDGATPISWKMTGSSENSYAFPLAAQEIAIWNNTIGSSMTATVEIASSSVLNTNDIWMEIEYLSSASYPLGSLVSTRPAFPTASVAIVTSSESWTGTPANKQKLVCTFTPQMKGVIKARIYFAKQSATVYVDPYLSLSNGEPNRVQYFFPGAGSINETAQGEFSYAYVG